MKKIYLSLILSASIFQFSFAQDAPQEQKIVITKIAATWCPPCGTVAWDNFTTLEETYPTDVIFLNIHPSRSSSLHSPTAIDFSANLPDAFGQPLFYINRTKYITNEILENAKNEVANSKIVRPIANTGINANVKGNELEVRAKVQFFMEENGEYYLSLLVIENGVIANQASRGANVSHEKTLRTSMTGNTLYNPIDNAFTALGSDFSIDATIEIEENWNSENLEVVAILWNKIGDFYEFVNANSVEVSFATSLNLLEKSGVEMTVTPTIVDHAANISLSLPIDLEKVNIDIFNVTGQQVLSLYSGDLPNGAHNFSFSKSALKGSGIYFLRMEKNGNVISRKFIVK